MLYETVGGFTIFLLMIYTGFNTAIFFDVKNFVTKHLTKSKFVDIFLDVLVTLASLFGMFAGILKYNYGTFRLHLVFAFIIGIAIQRYLLSKPLAKLFGFCYTKLKKAKDRFIEKRKITKSKKSNSAE